MTDTTNTPIPQAYNKTIREWIDRHDINFGTFDEARAAFEDAAARAMESRALAAEAKAPKVWDAETIKDAPEGRYNFTTIIISGGDEYVDWEKDETASKGELLEDLADVPEGDLPKLKFHGPIPQPPPMKEGE